MTPHKMMASAELVATFAHEAVGHKRKYTGDSYCTHLEEVANLVSIAPSCTIEMIDAAWLHDVVEDTQVTHGMLHSYFGVEVAALVFELTDQFTDPSLGNRKKRKAMEMDRLAKCSSKAHTIKCADLIDNTKSIVEYDRDFAKVYLAEKRAILDAIKGSADHTLWSMAMAALKDAETVLKRGI